MRYLTITEMMRLTRTEICSLATEVSRILREESEHSPEKTTQLNLQHIGRALGRKAPLLESAETRVDPL